MRRLIILAIAVFFPAGPAHALFGEEDWLSGQNQLLASLLAENLQQTTQLATAVANLRAMLRATNESAAVARTAWRQVQVLRRYSIADLRDDALAGLYDAWPELSDIAQETEALVANGRAVRAGAFWTHLDHHDPAVSRRARTAFEYGYQSTIWPIAFPDAMQYGPGPSPVDVKVQALYRRAGHAHRVATQQMAWSVFARQVEGYLADAEATQRLDTRIQATEAVMAFQTMRNTTEALTLAQTEAADDEARRQRDQRDRAGFVEALRSAREALWAPARTGRGGGR